MIKTRNRITTFLLSLAVIITTLFTINPLSVNAMSFTNAKEFYNSSVNYGHCAVSGDAVYFASMGKLASSSSNLKYQSLGFDVTLSASEVSSTISIARGQTFVEVASAEVKDDTYEYNLWKVSYKDLMNLVRAKSGDAVADTLAESSMVLVNMDAIITTKQNGNLNGSITENGSGGVSPSGTVWHLNNASDLATAKRTFAGHDFAGFMNIHTRIINPALTITYDANGGTVGNDYSLNENNLITSNNSPVKTSSRQLKGVTLRTTDEFALARIGYHLDPGAEWRRSGITTSYASGGTYNYEELYTNLGFSFSMLANWQANHYFVKYNANSGFGTMSDSEFTYDETDSLRGNTYYKRGYSFVGWSTTPTGAIAYANGIGVTNLTAENRGVVTLYAVWQPNVYEITAKTMTDALTSPGTLIYYEKYDTGFYKTGNIANNSVVESSKTDTIDLPTKTGYYIEGYYADLLEGGGLAVSGAGLNPGEGIYTTTGNILTNNSFYANDSIVYAKWAPKTYKLTFDKQGGVGGTDSVTVTYDAALPLAEAPVRAGYTFEGYFTKPDGKGTEIYNEFMAGMANWTIDANTTVYAYWKDITPPTLALNSNINAWTNQTITLTANAYDLGSGLDRVYIYYNNSIVAKAEGLNGAKTYALSYNVPSEGALLYKAVAYDIAGNVQESFKTVFYDITAPKGIVIEDYFDGTTLRIDNLYINDWNVQ